MPRPKIFYSVLLQTIKSTKNLFGAATRLNSQVHITLGVYLEKTRPVRGRLRARARNGMPASLFYYNP